MKSCLRNHVIKELVHCLSLEDQFALDYLLSGSRFASLQVLLEARLDITFTSHAVLGL